MKKDTDNPIKFFKLKTDNPKIGFFIIDHLNRAYCAKAHLIERLQEIIDHDGFTDLKTAITETITQLEKQVAGMDKIYTLLQINYSFEHCSGLISSLDNVFIAIQQQSGDKYLRDLSIISYLYFAESVEKAAFKSLHLTLNLIGNTEIEQLIKDSEDETKAGSGILSLIDEKYFKL